LPPGKASPIPSVSTGFSSSPYLSALPLKGIGGETAPAGLDRQGEVEAVQQLFLTRLR